LKKQKRSATTINMRAKDVGRVAASGGGLVPHSGERHGKDTTDRASRLWGPDSAEKRDCSETRRARGETGWGENGFGGESDNLDRLGGVVGLERKGQKSSSEMEGKTWNGWECFGGPCVVVQNKSLTVQSLSAGIESEMPNQEHHCHIKVLGRKSRKVKANPKPARDK